jgi:hypothetical protein
MRDAGHDIIGAEVRSVAADLTENLGGGRAPDLPE